MKLVACGLLALLRIGKLSGKLANHTVAIETLQRVIIMTPENLHLNSFMYEPILDMSDEHLRKLHTDIVALGELGDA